MEDQDSIIKLRRSTKPHKKSLGQDPFAFKDNQFKNLIKRSVDSTSSGVELCRDTQNSISKDQQQVSQSNLPSNLPQIRFKMMNQDVLPDDPLSPLSIMQNQNAGARHRILMTRGNPMGLDQIYNQSVASYNRALLR